MPEVVRKKDIGYIDTILDQIKQDERPRLDWVKQVVGFRQDMWDAAQEVIRSAKKQVFIVTSFSNPRFSDDVAELLAEASEGVHSIFSFHSVSQIVADQPCHPKY